MKMIRHDLRLIQTGKREMVWYRTPAFIYDAAHIIQRHHRIRSAAHDTTEQILPLRGT
jgi:hypothetical protein